MRHFEKLIDLGGLVGTEIALSEWLPVDQARITKFADATGDHAWIHVDEQRAAEGPFGKTVAHGFLTLSLIPLLADHAMKIDDIVTGINYGLNRVRFTAPVPVESRIRGRFKLKAFEAMPQRAGQNGAQLIWDIAIEREDSGKPSCVAEFIARYYTE
jgi:acyl dehydratase